MLFNRAQLCVCLSCLLLCAVHTLSRPSPSSAPRALACLSCWHAEANRATAPACQGFPTSVAGAQANKVVLHAAHRAEHWGDLGAGRVPLAAAASGVQGVRRQSAGRRPQAEAFGLRAVGACRAGDRTAEAQQGFSGRGAGEFVGGGLGCWGPPNVAGERGGKRVWWRAHTLEGKWQQRQKKQERNCCPCGGTKRRGCQPAGGAGAVACWARERGTLR